MQQTTGKTILLKLGSICLIIFGAIWVVVGLVATPSAIQSAGILGWIQLVANTIFVGIVYLIAGIVGMREIKSGTPGMLSFVYGLFATVSGIGNAAFVLISQSGDIASVALSVILPVLYLIGSLIAHTTRH